MQSLSVRAGAEISFRAALVRLAAKAQVKYHHQCGSPGVEHCRQQGQSRITFDKPVASCSAASPNSQCACAFK